MPQPAFSVSPASCTFFRMSSIESRMVPDTVQLIVEVAGLCSSAPALDVTRPAGIAPTAQRPQKAVIPLLANVLALGIGQRACHALVGVVHRLVDGRTVLGGQTVFFIPDVERRFLEGDRLDVFRFDFHDGIHWPAAPDFY